MYSLERADNVTYRSMSVGFVMVISTLMCVTIVEESFMEEAEEAEESWTSLVLLLLLSWDVHFRMARRGILFLPNEDFLYHLPMCARIELSPVSGFICDFNKIPDNKTTTQVKKKSNGDVGAG